MSHILQGYSRQPYRSTTQKRIDAWWSLLRSCCLQDDDYWYLQTRYHEDKHFKRIFFNNLSNWFLRTAKSRSQRGSVNTLWYGPQRGSKSYSLIDFSHRLDPTFLPHIKDRITFQLRDLKSQLSLTKPGQFRVHDEIKKSAYGEGSKWTMDEISDFLEILDSA